MSRRQILPAPMAVDLLDAIGAEARRRGVSVERLIDEAMVAELPELVAEVVRAALSAEVTPDAATPPALTGGATDNLTERVVTRSIPLGGPITGPPGDAAN
jgi:hypothetical protein